MEEKQSHIQNQAKVTYYKSVGKVKIKRKNKEPLVLDINNIKSKTKKAILITMVAYVALSYGNNIYASTKQQQINTEAVTPYSTFSFSDYKPQQNLDDIGYQIASSVYEEKALCDIYNSINNLNESNENYKEYNVEEHFIKYLSISAQSLVHDPGYYKINAINKTRDKGWLVDVYNYAAYYLNCKIPGVTNMSFEDFLDKYNLDNRDNDYNYLTDEYSYGEEEQDITRLTAFSNLVGLGEQYQIKYLKEDGNYFEQMKTSMFGECGLEGVTTANYITANTGTNEIIYMQYNPETKRFSIVERENIKEDLYKQSEESRSSQR